MLERGGVIGREANVCQASEAGRNSVDDRSCLENVHDHLPGRIDSAEDVFVQPRACTPGDPDDVLDPERAAKFHRWDRNHEASIASRGARDFETRSPASSVTTVMLRRVADSRIPEELFTARLLLRRWRLSDLDELAGIFAQREVWEFPFGGA